MNFKAVIFDLDGTLLDTLEDIADAANHVLSHRGFPNYDTDAYRHFVGDGINILFTRVLPEEKQNEEAVFECVQAFREAYGHHWNIKTKPYDGVPEMLDGLTARGLKMAVLSNKPDDFAKKCVAELLSKWRFEVVSGFRNGIPPKPDPGGALQIAEILDIEPEQILYLGDTDVDMKTAIAAGMFPVGALWGFRSVEELRNSGAEKVIALPQDLLHLI
ncbi:MAG: HAD family hydrolase [Deltaproteobacteria bacterium]|nr:HAD family hydrolase [Deltaproteobacteria bacterium]